MQKNKNTKSANFRVKALSQREGSAQRSPPTPVKESEKQLVNRSQILLSNKAIVHKYSNSLYHKSSFPLKPLRQNPSLFTKLTASSNKFQCLNAKAYPHKGTQRTEGRQRAQGRQRTQGSLGDNEDKIVEQSQTNVGDIDKNSKENVKASKKAKLLSCLLPQSITIRSQLNKLLEKGMEKILEEDTVMLITAKKWIIYDMEEGITLKGYKHKKIHDAASISKLLTFLTAYKIIHTNFIAIDKMDMYVHEDDENVGGNKIDIRKQNIITLQHLLYALLLPSANNSATTLANNLGSFLRKKKEGGYFSCYDIPLESREQNMETFLNAMREQAQNLGLTQSTFNTVHGLHSNKMTALDASLLLAHCMKIPLFTQISSSESHPLRIHYIGESGEYEERQLVVYNTNRLLTTSNHLYQQTVCIAGKTGYNKTGGESFVGCFEGGVIVAVFGCAGKQDKFIDAEKLVNWLAKKLKSS